MTALFIMTARQNLQSLIEKQEKELLDFISSNVSNNDTRIQVRKMLSAINKLKIEYFLLPEEQ